MTEYKPINMDRSESHITVSGGTAFDGTYQTAEEVKPKFNVSEELQKAIAAVINKVESKSFSGRHPELGKMVNCQVCSTRHRTNERKCEQKFTYSVGDYEYFRENEKGELVPDYRTALRPDENPTKRQVNGSAAYAKKRFHPHLSGYKNVFVERTRKVFEELEFDINADKEVFQKNLQRARVLAAREIREEQELNARAIRRRQDRSRRINKGLL